MVFDFRNMRATELPFNKRVCLPGPLEEATEIAIQNLKGRLNQITNEYVKKKEQTRWSNLDKVEKEGLRSLKEKLQSKEEVIFQTDKSGHFSVDQVGNYKSTCEKHTDGDVDVTEEEYNRLQQVINAHAVSWVRMLSAGAGNNEQTRIKNNMIGMDSPMPPLYGTPPPIRPVCGAAASYSNRLSHVVSTILTELWRSKEDNAMCISMEEMIAEMKKVNSVQVDNDLVVGSPDVKALYLSLDMDLTIEKVCDVFFE